MAGSYTHVITNQGNLSSPEMVNSMLENGGDVFEAVEEMYGMIWWLAHNAETIKMMPEEDAVEMAQQHYQEGLKFAKKNRNKRGPDGSQS